MSATPALRLSVVRGQPYSAIAFPVYHSGRVATLEYWFKRFERAELVERYPAVALHGARVHALRGRPEQAWSWLDAAMRGTFTGKLPDGSRSIKPWVDVLKAALCRKGAKPMLADAEAALAGLPKASNWRPSANLPRINTKASGSAWTLCATSVFWKTCGRRDAPPGDYGDSSPLGC